MHSISEISSTLHNSRWKNQEIQEQQYREKAYSVESTYPRKKADVPFGSGQDRFKKFLPLNVLPGPGQYDQSHDAQDDQSNNASSAFKSHSPRLQMYYELERTLSKSVLSLDKQEILAKQLVHLIDRKMKERQGQNLVSRSAMNQSLDSPKAKKILTGLAITSNTKQEKVPSIPYEPRKEERNELVGPTSYNPNLDSIHKRLPNLTVLSKKEPLKPIPKKALESFINTIFQGNSSETDGLLKERSSTTLRTKHIRLGKGSFSGAKTQVTSPRKQSQDQDSDEEVDPFNKPSSIFISKTKRSNLIDEKALGPGVYNPHEYKQIGPKKESEFKKKVDFGSMEGRKFTMHRNLASPFKDSTYIENPPSWKYQNPSKESVFFQKSHARRSDSLQLPQSFSSVAKVVEHKNEIPGPGTYDVNFKEELKVLDQKLSIRYQLGPFGSTAPRFKEKPQTQPETTAQNDQKSQQVFNIIKKQEMRKYMDEALKLIKDMQKNQESSIFKSVTERFKEHQTSGSLLMQPSTQIGSLGGGSIEESRLTEPSTMQSITGGPSTSRLKSYSVAPATTLYNVTKPFDSTSPRFNYKKIEDAHQKHPGPGHYAMHYEDKEELNMKEIQRTGTINKKYAPAIGNENRQKFSLFGQIVNKGQSSVLGPGSYETHAHHGVSSKKIFNASLMKPAQSPFNQNSSLLANTSLSTVNPKPSPRSTLS